MKAIDNYSLEPIRNEPRSMLVNRRAATGLVVPGRVLEAQFVAAAGTLLFITHDIPFEEQLDILLVRDDAVIVDNAALWGSLTTGNFRNVSVLGPDAVCFDFFGDRPWRVRILPRATFAMPIGFGVIGVHRPFGWRRWLIVEHAGEASANVLA
jgi:hypothetical protein